MVEIIKTINSQIERISLENNEDYTLKVTKEDNSIAQIELEDNKGIGIEYKGFILSSKNQSLNIFVQLLKEFINVRQL
jgi:hypothetical protein